MDVLLVAPLLGALLWVGKYPFRAGVLFSLAGSLKIWPLLLAPVLFRGWRHRPKIYISVAALVATLTAISLAPMFLQLNPDPLETQSGLSAYSATWTNSSFIFPGIRDAIGLIFDNSDRLARYAIAFVLTGFSLWLGFLRPQDKRTLPVTDRISLVFHLVSDVPAFCYQSLVSTRVGLANHWGNRVLRAFLHWGVRALFDLPENPPPHRIWHPSPRYGVGWL